MLRTNTFGSLKPFGFVVKQQKKTNPRKAGCPDGFSSWALKQYTADLLQVIAH